MNKELAFDFVKNFKAFFFDFDGVILDSNGIKDKAFEVIFADFPQVYQQIWQFHKQHNTLTRLEKFRYLYRDILGIENPEAQVAELGRRFQDLTLKQLAQASTLPGVRDFLSLVAGHGCPVWLCSATPDEDLAMVMKWQRLESFFSRISGARHSKAAFLARLLEENKLQGHEVCYFGDSPEDLAAARQNQVFFIGVCGNSDFAQEAVPVIYDFQSISPQLLAKSL